MKAIVQHKHGAPDVLERQERLGRVTGLLYLVIAVLGMFAPIALQTFVVPGDAATSANNILGSRWLFGSSLVSWIVLVVADVAVAVTLYLLLEPVSRALSLVAAALRLVYAAILGAIVLNLYDAFLLLTSAARGAGLAAPQRQTMALSALATFSAGFLLALVFLGWWCLAACSTARAAFRARWGSSSLLRASATSWTLSRTSSCPTTAAL